MTGRSAIRRTTTTLLTLALLCSSAPLFAQGADYVTVEEEDLIRDAQGLQARVPLYLKFLDNRIVALGLRERTAKEREQEKKDLADYEHEAKAAASAKNKGDVELRAKPLLGDVYLRKETKTELLRGYMQIVDETMDYIDDSFEQRLDVRDYVQTLEKFLQEQLSRFARLETQTPAEVSALKATVSHSEQAIEDCQKALRSLPKTERIPANPKG
jgi:hypothetical protein